MIRAVLSLGSNVGDRFAYLQKAIDGFGEMVAEVSPVYETEPWGVFGQEDFLNAVFVVRSDDVDPHGLLTIAQDLEREVERIRGVKWGPRKLDVDIVHVDGVVSDDPDLTLPHPGAHRRSTVLVPWYDIEPDAEIPGHGRIADLVAGMDTSDVVPRPDLVLHTGCGRPIT
ncbi:2-amino-4-hydroxy-6-hydroxymethyldihydropteridine diphosphokinase [Herbihabitans rhizosphaerae]|uniref:2-amino-4-hydroxy-6-hydroxymethyldihydropteridine diphosphokinase n=1 Tax=Herbihabitans rhizosphaerae TaxID=1872711 RepID=A0A4Q7KX62_9PSEU|nr:2-amino-4-hydroxy-6-hydroxymethyldihydropteridine diphosphokinase [Herbihabitans rhizosphaerae]RZS41216.1 2-amino-4-hydroxy-6-hydroxymethyldihydropteridine diphosphokinase [Herbihabitans rhizosphaerae]